MNDKLSDDKLRRLREYIAEETKRLGECGGRILKCDFEELDLEKVCSIPAAQRDPLERDVDALFGSSGKQ
jgi:hypothetical protein